MAGNLAFEMEIEFSIEIMVGGGDFLKEAAKAQPHGYDSFSGAPRTRATASRQKGRSQLRTSGFHLFAASFFVRELELGFAAGFGIFPFGLEPSAGLPSDGESGIERALVDLEEVFGDFAGRRCAMA